MSEVSSSFPAARMIVRRTTGRCVARVPGWWTAGRCGTRRAGVTMDLDAAATGVHAIDVIGRGARARSDDATTDRGSRNFIQNC